MNRLQQLQNRQATLYASLEEISSKVAEEDRDLSDDEKASITKLNAELAKVEDKDTGIPYEEKRLAAHKLALASGKSTTVGKTDEKEAKEDVIKFPTLTKRLAAFKGEHSKLDAYKSGQFLLATLGNNAKARQWCDEHGVQCLAQSEGINTAGGYLVPDEMSAGIIDLREEYGVFRREARVLSMSGDSIYVNRRVSGLTAYWVGEGTAITDSSKVFDQVQMTAKKLGALTYWSSEVNEDALINWADDLSKEMAYAFALKEDQCGFLGDGTSTYAGIHGIATKINAASGVTYAGSIVTAATGNTAFSTLDLDDFEKVVGELPQFAGINAKWYVSKPGFANSMMRLAYAGGGTTKGDVAGGYGLSFLGYPVVVSQVLNSTLSAQTDTIVALFGDLRMAATLADRRGISVQMSDQVRFTQDQMAIKATERFDILVHELGDATNAGPIIALKTPGS